MFPFLQYSPQHEFEAARAGSAPGSSQERRASHWRSRSMVDLMEIGTSQKQTTTMLPELPYPPENKNVSLAVLRHMFES